MSRDVTTQLAAISKVHEIQRKEPNLKVPPKQIVGASSLARQTAETRKRGRRKKECRSNIDVLLSLSPKVYFTLPNVTQVKGVIL